jgi:hypothetical protein
MAKFGMQAYNLMKLNDVEVKCCQVKISYTWCGCEVPIMILLHKVKAMPLDHSEAISAHVSTCTS